MQPSTSKLLCSAQPSHEWKSWLILLTFHGQLPEPECPFTGSNSSQPLATASDLSWAWMALPQDGKVRSGVFPSHHHSQTQELLRSQQQCRHRTALSIPISQPHSLCTAPHPESSGRSPGALPEGWDGQGLHQDTSVSPHPLCNCPFPLSPGHAAQDRSKCCPFPVPLHLIRGAHLCLLQGNEHLDGAGQISSAPR